MIVQTFYLKKYGWRVRVFYAVSHYHVERIVEALREIGCRGRRLREAMASLIRAEIDTGLTYSNYLRRETVMVIGMSSTAAEYDNSIRHEAHHLHMHIAEACGLDPYGEPVAYLVGETSRAMHPAASRLTCECCLKEVREGGR